MGKRERKGSIIALALAFVLTVGGALFGAVFYRAVPREEATAEIVHREPVLPEITAEGLVPEGEIFGEESSELDDASSESLAEESSSADSRGEALAGDGSSSGADAVVRTDSADSSVIQRETEILPPAPVLPDLPAQTVGDGRETDREYFTTSIQDGERVRDSIYFFTVTHLIDSLELVRCDVQVNGEVQEGYAGRCRLTEGANAIRVSCTYTDGENKLYRAFRDYTVYLESADNAISTDLSDCVVYEAEFRFTAECADGLEVRLNGRAVEGNVSYAVTLEEGDNVITLTSGERRLAFTVTYIVLRELDIVTDLADCTVYGETFAFTARAVGGSSPSLTVQLNGKTVRGADGAYTVTLKEGANSIRLLAKDGADRAERIFTVICLPEYDEEKLPRFGSISLTDNMTVKGGAYSLSLKAEDCNGRRIYSDGIEVVCGGRAVSLGWEDAAGTGYRLSLTPGENSVYIRLTDSAGRQSEFFYRINCETAETGEEIGRIAISVRADTLGLGTLCEDSSFPVLEGESGFDTVERFLKDMGFGAVSSGSGNSRYLSRITMPGRFASAAPTEEELAHLAGAGISVNGGGDPDSLGEFDFTPSSGWIFFQNGRKVSYGISSAVFAEGDRVELRFSLDLGNDLGSVGE